jgi:CDGSH-type Zn-finger protein/predicted 2-oxoglutarate/Fe(II)-dependent dioxygenase YbiX
MEHLGVEGGYIKTEKTQCICGYSANYPFCDNTHLKINEKFKKEWDYKIRAYPKHPNLQEVIPGIYIISDFISQDQVKEVMDFLRDNKNNTLRVDETNPNPKMMDNRLIDISGKGLSIADIDFSPLFDGLYSPLPIMNIMKYEIGEEFPPHQDTSVYCPIESDWGLVLYINDDFEGGELYYPEKNITYRPQSGDLVIHGATEEFAHGTTPITKGTKYVATSFAFLFPRKER